MSLKRGVFVLFWFTSLTTAAVSSSYLVNIGAIFDADQEEEETAFKHAVDLVNNENYSYEFVPITKRVKYDNEFDASRSVCSMFSAGVLGIFGPSSTSSSHYVQSICDTMEIPHVETMWNFRQQRGSCLVNIFPYPPMLSYVFVDLVKVFGWKKFTVIYENNDSLIRINAIIKMSDFTGVKVSFQQLDAAYTGNYRNEWHYTLSLFKCFYRPALMEVKKSGDTDFILDCSIEILGEVLKQAMQVGIMCDAHRYIITNLDLQTIDLFPFQHGGANITGIQLIDPNDNKMKKIARALQKQRSRYDQRISIFSSPKKVLRTKTALMYDAVHLFANALQELSISKVVYPKQLYCNASNSWEHGYSLINYIKTNSINGLTGNVKFDHQGFRSDFTLNIIELSTIGVQKIGYWNSTEGLKLSRPAFCLPNIEEDTSLHNKSFIVLIALTDPYGMLKKTSQKLLGNDRFEGFGIDLIHQLSLMLGFNYTFKLQEDGNYGSQNLSTGEWDGMIRELLDKRADLAITDLTITSEREGAVDFTSPFMNLGISILYKKPMKLPPSLFSFMSPFSESVWYYLGGAYIGVSLMLYLMARISPAEWTNGYPCNDDPQFLENQFSFKNCFWFTLGSLMQQGSELAPIAISTRMVAGTWWFFTLIMVSSYTANLAAFLTVESLSSPFKTIEELANQDVIKYGAKRGGATSNFFRNSTYSTYQKIWKTMEANPSQMTTSNPEGVKRAEKENYAFFMESTTIEYTIEQHCNLTQIGRLLDDKGYGIAMRKNNDSKSTYRHVLSTAVLKLQETGKLRDLKRKWWKEKRSGGICHSDTNTGDAAELGLPNLGGVFFVLVVGSVAGLLVAIIEKVFDITNLAFRNNTTFATELKEEVIFFLKFKHHIKPVRYRKSRRLNKDTFIGFKYPPENLEYLPEMNKQPIH